MSEAKVLSNYSLKSLNTFGVDVLAQEFCVFRSIAQLQSLLSKSKDVFVLGGGSNMLLTKDIDRLVLKNEILGIRVYAQYEEELIVTCGGGEQWHDVVMWAVAHNYGGIENLSLIPGCIGAAPIQNIGAYGVELKDVFVSLRAVDISTGELKVFDRQDCGFGYRDSVFKNELKDKFVICEVNMKLSKTNHRLKLDYGNIKSYLEDAKIEKASIKEISDAVIAIRSNKLPDPDVIGNSGSFFKNPIVEESRLTAIKKKYAKVPSYEIGEYQYKIPAAWLIEKLGWKAHRDGDAGVYENHALVIVNHGNATGEQLLNLSKEIQKSVLKEFNISLHSEVNIF